MLIQIKHYNIIVYERSLNPFSLIWISVVYVSYKVDLGSPCGCMMVVCALSGDI